LKSKDNAGSSERPTEKRPEALAEIRDAKLYRIEHKTFEEYCRTKWNFTKTQANRLIGAAQVTENLTPMGVKPNTESQARPLTKLPPDKQPEAWSKAATEQDIQHCID